MLKVVGQVRKLGEKVERHHQELLGGIQKLAGGVQKLADDVQKLGGNVQQHRRESMGDLETITTTLEATAIVLGRQDERLQDHEARIKKLESKVA
ncbi:MAG TPA: hypothetical protein VIG99_19010 [Myxococcaceae bacterium]